MPEQPKPPTGKDIGGLNCENLPQRLVTLVVASHESVSGGGAVHGDKELPAFQPIGGFVEKIEGGFQSRRHAFQIN